MKKSLIYTGGGDKGMTSLVGGQRISKADSRIESYGTVDELNSFVGWLNAMVEDEEDKKTLLFIQHKLFTVGSYLATDQSSTDLRVESQIDQASIERLEREIDRLDSTLPRYKRFILPGGNQSAALAHVCRTVCRRSERQVCRLAGKVDIEDALLTFINRLSDYFFVLARKECIKHERREIIWDNTCI
jgi:cob(I)alamin adenosyltransferase